MLKYVGKGFVPNIPARDLSEDDVKRFGNREYLLKIGVDKDFLKGKSEEEALLSFGLWEKKALKANKENKMLQPEEAANKED